MTRLHWFSIVGLMLVMVFAGPAWGAPVRANLTDPLATSQAVRTALAEGRADGARETPTPVRRATPAADGQVGSREDPIPLGTEADTGGEWFVSVVEVIPDATDLVLAENQFNDRPASGNQFFIVRISATYEGERSSTFPATNALSLVGESSVAYTPFADSCGVVPDALSSTEVFTGGTVEGNVCWQVQSDEVDSLVMYSEDFITFDRDRQAWFALRD